MTKKTPKAPFHAGVLQHAKMIKEQLQKAMRLPYPVHIYYVEDANDKKAECWIAYLPEFGASVCSASGDSPEEALDCLKKVKRAVFKHYIEQNKQFPAPVTFAGSIIKLLLKGDHPLEGNLFRRGK